MVLSGVVIVRFAETKALLSIVTVIKPVQFLNALFAISVTLLGIVIEVSPVQLLNAFAPILVTL